MVSSGERLYKGMQGGARYRCMHAYRQVRNGVSDVVIRHGQNRQLGNRPRVGFVRVLRVDHAARALVNGGQIRVHVAGVAAAARHFFPGCTHFAQSVSVGRHVREDDQNVVVPLVSQVPARYNRREKASRKEAVKGRGRIALRGAKTRRFSIALDGTQHGALTRPWSRRDAG